MSALVQTIPGFIRADGYASPTGESLGIIRFDSLEALRAWRDHPDHVIAQRRGREEFYASYRVEVCDVIRAYDFSRD